MHSWQGKPYNFFGDYLSVKYGCKVLKLPVDAGMSCPNRDGALDTRGCIFCSEEGSASPTATHSREIREQMECAVTSFARTFEKVRYIAYFQAFTNTYATVEHLRELYDTALSFPDVTGLMIGTRPDCLTPEILDLIASYKKDNFELWLEIGMQSMHDRSLSFLNRHHTHADTRCAVYGAAERGIPVCVHIILGIPGESWKDIMATAEEVSSLPVSGVKIHHLHVIKGTELETLYLQNSFPLISQKEYISTLCDFIERLREDIIIHRITGDRDINTLVAPKWGALKGTIQAEVEAEFARRGTWQGLMAE
ncbi:MAG: TIGR01212 family radical SAM protein [Spirochaetota bacterium]